MTTKKDADPCTLVIFGASGDLTRRKLLPALFELHTRGYLAEPISILGVSRSEMSDDAYRDRARPWCESHPKFTEESWRQFASRLSYVAADATNADGFAHVTRAVRQLDSSSGTHGNVLLYLSVAPQLCEPIVECVGASGLVTEGRQWCSVNRHTAPWQRVIVEKPFGHDLASAEHLNRVLGRAFEDDSIYCIDHYLGKETVQNLLVFRFANAIFEPLWTRTHIDHVQISAAEAVGVEGRGGYFEKSGALRDMIQSHLLQLMAAVAMEPPNSFDARDLRAEQRKVLQAVQIMRADEVERYAVRGQYVAGSVGGKELPAYVREPGVAADSTTETYAALRLHVENWRWQGVPFLLRSGKAMKRKLTQIAITFRPTPQTLFRGRPDLTGKLAPNRLILNLQPDEGISLRFEGKVPGQELKIRSAVLDFDFVREFGGHVPEAYAHLLLDAMRGDQSLFKDRHEIEAAWRIVMPVLEQWAADPRRGLCDYPAGSWGPSAAEALFAGRGAWHDPEGNSTRVGRAES